MPDREGTLEQTIAQLRKESTRYEDFIVKCCELIPEGYDMDESAENIIIRFLEDMDKFAGIIARLTSAYR
jgi:hypothetical protein